MADLERRLKEQELLHPHHDGGILRKLHLGKEHERTPTGIWVVKIGTTALIGPKGINYDTFYSVAHQIIHLKRKYGISPVLVTSGAVKYGRIYYESMGMEVPEDTRVLAAAGQPFVVNLWGSIFNSFDEPLPTCQVLFGPSPRQIKHTLHSILDSDSLPVVNTNDVLKALRMKKYDVGRDNDELAATIAKVIDADVLVYLTNRFGIEDREGRLVRKVFCVEGGLEAQNIEFISKSKDGTGGMEVKFKEGKGFAELGGGRRVIIGYARNTTLLGDLAKGKAVIDCSELIAA